MVIFTGFMSNKFQHKKQIKIRVEQLYNVFFFGTKSHLENYSSFYKGKIPVALSLRLMHLVDK